MILKIIRARMKCRYYMDSVNAPVNLLLHKRGCRHRRGMWLLHYTCLVPLGTGSRGMSPPKTPLPLGGLHASCKTPAHQQGTVTSP